MTRREGKRSIGTLWIFCEGETEEIYFSKLRQDERVKMKIIVSPNKDAPGILNHAIEYKKGNRKDFEKDDVIFCVFDRDRNNIDKHGKNQIDSAKNLADKNGIKIIFSNPSFEYWFLCHYELHLQPIEKEDIERKLERHIPGYKKMDTMLYFKLKDSQERAKQNANKSITKHNKSSIIHRECNPVTNVHELLQLLDRFK
jgi:hypothetical protein